MQERVLGCDPGPERSAFALLVNGVPSDHNWVLNEVLLDIIPTFAPCHLSIETLYPRAEPVSRDAMFGQLWAGRFIQAAGVPFSCVDEDDSRFAATGKPGAKLRDVRLGLLNIFGEDKQVPCDCNDGRIDGKRSGTTKICPRCKGAQFVTVPGPLATYGEHERSALAAALWWWQKHQSRRETAEVA